MKLVFSEGHRVHSDQELPVCLSGDRLEFAVACFPTLQLGNITCTATEHEGDSWDGASIPRWAWSIFGHPLASEFRWASYWHDRLCESARTIEDRTAADAVFLRLLSEAGVSKWRRLLMWAAVRCYGVFLWRAKRA
jgi:hypothetical protein